MELTRLNTGKLTAATEKAVRKLEEALEIMAPLLVVLTDSERASMLRPRVGFDEAGRKLSAEAKHHPELAKAVSFDGAAVVEDLDNVKVLSRLATLANKLDQLVADSQLTWNAEAYQPALLFYALAKVAARENGALRDVIEPMSEIFPGGRRKKAPEPEHK